jgi:tagatose-6-phosphate ketose/aldose isomerase
MTGSFSSMLLTGLLLPFIDNLESMDKNVEMMIEYGKVILNKYNDRLKEIASREFNRAVFLGSGFFSGVAREQHLKLQELTDGKVICKYDSFLGFRHGPKAVMNGEALISYIFSNNEYSQKYEIDLSKTIVTGKTAMFQIGIMEHNIPEVNTDLKIVLNETNNEKIAEEFLAPVVVLPAQILGFHKSVALGLKPDMPSESGLISRVVEGVNLYEYENVI